MSLDKLAGEIEAMAKAEAKAVTDEAAAEAKKIAAERKARSPRTARRPSLTPPDHVTRLPLRVSQPQGSATKRRYWSPAAPSLTPLGRKYCHVQLHQT